MAEAEVDGFGCPPSPVSSISTRPELAVRPFWSVMIPTYRPNEEYLKATLESVLGQDPGSAEMQIEVVDDGSPEGPPVDLVREVAGDRVEVSGQDTNLGLARVWNRCIDRARGHWVHILHQDDLVYPGFYEALRAGVEAQPQVGAAFCRHAYCDHNGHWNTLSSLEMSDPGVLPKFVESLVTGYHIQCASMAVKRSTYEQLGGFNSALKHALDWEMWIRVANAFPLFYEPQVLAAWRVHPGATTSKQMRSGENIRDIAAAIAIWSHSLPESDAERLSNVALRRFATEALSGARHFLTKGDFEACQNQIAEALACDSSFAFRRRALRIQLSALAACFRIKMKRMPFLIGARKKRWGRTPADISE